VDLIHTCYRVTDPDRSVAFYELPIRDEAVNIFLGVPGKPRPELELTYNFGVDSYELGTGYGHVALAIDDLDGTLARLAEQGIEPERAPYTVREGGSRLAFVRDPDGYRIELIER
jgi:lactoylglutathione lyase